MKIIKENIPDNIIALANEIHKTGALYLVPSAIIIGNLKYMSDTNALRSILKNGNHVLPNYINKETALKAKKAIITFPSDKGIVIITADIKDNKELINSVIFNINAVYVVNTDIGNKLHYKINVTDNISLDTYKKLNIYHIQENGHVDYDGYTDIVCVCRNEDEAKEIASEYDMVDYKIEKIGVATKDYYLNRNVIAATIVS